MNRGSHPESCPILTQLPSIKLRENLRATVHAAQGNISIAILATDWTFSILPKNFPFIQVASRKQMRDAEFVAQLLLLIEQGPKSYSQDDLDETFSSRDPEWERMDEVVAEYQAAIRRIDEIVRVDATGDLARSRLKNQADFYSLVGAVASLLKAGQALATAEAFDRLNRFIDVVEDEQR